MSEHTRRLLTSAVGFPESPRWRDGQLWFSDVHNFCLKCCDAGGLILQEIAVPERPAGLAFMPDRRLLGATALGRRLYWLDGERLVQAADVSSSCRGLLNDMVADGTGRAYVGDTGFDLAAGEAPRPGQIFCFDERHGARPVCDDVSFPNGMTVSPDGTTLYVSESFANRISKFQIHSNGDLGPRANHAEIDGVPDGLCLDADGALWVADFTGGRFLRIDADGSLIDTIDAGMANGISCMLGGPARKDLYLCSAQREGAGAYVGKIEVVSAPAAGCGWP